MQIHELTQRRRVDEALPNWMDPKADIKAVKKAGRAIGKEFNNPTIAGKVGKEFNNPTIAPKVAKAVGKDLEKVGHEFNNPTIAPAAAKAVGDVAGKAASAVGGAIKKGAQAVGSAVGGAASKAGSAVAGSGLMKAFNDPSTAAGSNTAYGTAQANARLQAATKDFAQRLAAEWVKQSAQLVAADKATATARPTASPTVQPPAGVRMPKVQAKPGQMPASVAQSRTGQQMQQAFGQPRGGIQGMQSDLEEAFSDLPGAKPQAGGAVKPSVTAPLPKYVADKAQRQQQQKIATGQLSSQYAKSFQNWVNQRLSTRETNTGQTITLSTVLKRVPGIDQQLKTALQSVYTSRNDPAKLQAATEKYLTTAATGFQQAAAQVRQENPDAVAKSVTSKSKKRVEADPQTERIMQAIGMADSGLDTLADIVQQKGEKVTNKTGSNTIDRLLTAAGLI
jgi:hypothetical protein